MKKYEGYLLCTDMDGTFALTEENFAAIRHFQQNGGLFTIASGRTCAYILSFKDQFIPNAPVIAMNGAMICDQQDGRLLHRFPLSRDILPILDEAGQSGLPNLIILYGEADAPLEWRREDNCLPSERLSGLSGVLYKAILVQDAASALTLRDLLRDRCGNRFRVSRSWKEGVEIQAIEGGKGESLKWLRAYLDGVHTTVGVGDYENDLSLIESADIGYAVGNALDEVKAAADRLTVAHTENAIARIIDELG